MKEEIVEILVREGFISFESVAYSSIANLCAVEEFDVVVAELLKDRARETLIDSVVSGEADEDDVALSSVPGLSAEVTAAFNGADINDQDDLAEAAVDEILELHESINEAQAAERIMFARRRWFSDEEG